MKVNLQARANSAERRRAATRQRLIDAAMRVIARKGADAASIGDFVIEAGVSRGVFYNYFPCVEDLVVAVRNHVLENADADIMAVMAGVDDPAEQLARAGMRYIDMSLRDGVWGWVWLRLEGAAGATAAPSVVRQFNLLFSRGLETGRFLPADPTAALSLTVGAVRMAMRMMLSGEMSADGAAETVKLVLIALGVPYADAGEVMARLSPPSDYRFWG